MERNEDLPDRSYWTAYDHFMVEREARALRRRYVRVMIGRHVLRIARRVRKAVAGVSPVPAFGRARTARNAA